MLRGDPGGIVGLCYMYIIKLKKQNIYSGWWYTCPSEKYESVGVLTFPIYRKIKHVPSHHIYIYSVYALIQLYHVLFKYADEFNFVADSTHGLESSQKKQTMESLRMINWP